MTQESKARPSWLPKIHRARMKMRGQNIDEATKDQPKKRPPEGRSSRGGDGATCWMYP
ncbi:hypothetical protein [Capillimicrobium parvum]|uniref:Uncharacterized protein n=1 Tax=Capillimicrobium parvum TaxID=2884022 RepID=A0A9E6XWD7_9ACTN|nr:hypothetical protein [Capillimicrobium parvum]UGS35643.1 hypothetical protein DSM104329_02038 [Capillimicrobium parvum]